jgi:hypothetical protein
MWQRHNNVRVEKGFVRVLLCALVIPIVSPTVHIHCLGELLAIFGGWKNIIIQPQKSALFAIRGPWGPWLLLNNNTVYIINYL